MTLEEGGDINDGYTVARKLWNNTFDGNIVLSYTIHCTYNKTLEEGRDINEGYTLVMKLWNNTFEDIIFFCR